MSLNDIIPLNTTTVKINKALEAETRKYRKELDATTVKFLKAHQEQKAKQQIIEDEIDLFAKPAINIEIPDNGWVVEPTDEYEDEDEDENENEDDTIETKKNYTKKEINEIMVLKEAREKIEAREKHQPKNTKRESEWESTNEPEPPSKPIKKPDLSRFKIKKPSKIMTEDEETELDNSIKEKRKEYKQESTKEPIIPINVVIPEPIIIEEKHKQESTKEPIIPINVVIPEPIIVEEEQKQESVQSSVSTYVDSVFADAQREKKKNEKTSISTAPSKFDKISRLTNVNTTLTNETIKLKKQLAELQDKLKKEQQAHKATKEELKAMQKYKNRCDNLDSSNNENNIEEYLKQYYKPANGRVKCGDMWQHFKTINTTNTMTNRQFYECVEAVGYVKGLYCGALHFKNCEMIV